MRAVNFLATAAILFSASPVAFGQQAAEGEASGQYVPRSEYERLKKDFETLKEQVAQIQQQTSITTEKPVQHSTQSREQVLKEAKEPEQKQGFELLPSSELTPGWERIRAPGWMGPGRRASKGVRIARAGDMDLFMGLDTVGRFQYLTQRNVKDTVGSDSVLSGQLSPGFQTAFGNLSFLADFDKQMEVYFDMFIADRPHQDHPQGDEGYILLRSLPDPLGDTPLVKAVFDTIDVKAGQFELDFGDAHYRRSLNATVQRNPLIGNYVIDPRDTEIGMEVSSDEGRFPVNWLVGVGSGSDTEDFQKNHGPSLHGKLWAYPLKQLRTSSSIYWVDQSKTPSGSSSRTNLFRANRSGGPYAGVLDNSSAPGEVFPVTGKRVLATQVDATWEGDPVEWYGHFGWVQDGDNNGNLSGSPRTSWLYYAAEGSYHFTPRLYGALRYSGAAAQRLVAAADSSRDVGSDGLVHRIQLGGGYWLTKTVLLKGEYVYQLYSGFSSTGSQVSGVDVWRHPHFQGVLAEASFAF